MDEGVEVLSKYPGIYDNVSGEWGMMMWIRGNNLKVSTMKIYKILFAAAVALSIVSCSKESVQESVKAVSYTQLTLPKNLRVYTSDSGFTFYTKKI